MVQLTYTLLSSLSACRLALRLITYFRWATPALTTIVISSRLPLPVLVVVWAAARHATQAFAQFVHARTHARKHANTRARAHTHTRPQPTFADTAARIAPRSQVRMAGQVRGPHGLRRVSVPSLFPHRVVLLHRQKGAHRVVRNTNPNVAVAYFCSGKTPHLPSRPSAATHTTLLPLPTPCVFFVFFCLNSSRDFFNPLRRSARSLTAVALTGPRCRR